MAPPLGFVSEPNRTAAQQAAHASAMAFLARRPAFALPIPVLKAGQAIRLFDIWKDPRVVADVGFVFTRIHQVTGSCVWAGGTNALFSTIAAQRVAGANPTKAFLPFTLHNYALSRHYFGEDAPGEGSLGSTFFRSLDEDGVRAWPDDGSDGLPTYTQPDGLVVGKAAEMGWSSIHNPRVAAVAATTREHTIGSSGLCRTVADVRAMVSNGYGVTFACDRYIGHASIRGTGDDAYVRGKWDSVGGHQQSIHAIWEHPTDGPLYWAQNNWDGNTYPADPAGGPVCGCWVAEADVAAAMGYHAEVFGLSHLDWFPAQDLLSYFE